MKRKGTLIVIDGNDGSGKATQTALLAERLRKNKIKTETIDFPRYATNFFGKFIGECLAGEHGDFVTIDPRIGSTLYAADRFESKKQIELWLSQGKVVICDRYVSANQIHQGGKIKEPKKMKEFLLWLDAMEHGVFGIPRPEAIVYLDVPLAVSRRLLSNTNDKKKSYLKKGSTQDSVESNIAYLDRSRKNALKIVKSLNKWYRVDCVRNNKIKDREDIHEQVVAIVRELLPHVRIV